MLTMLQDERGQGMVEYGLILALVAVLLIGAVIGLKDGLTSVFDKATQCMMQAALGNGC